MTASVPPREHIMATPFDELEPGVDYAVVVYEFHSASNETHVRLRRATLIDTAEVANDRWALIEAREALHAPMNSYAVLAPKPRPLSMYAEYMKPGDRAWVRACNIGATWATAGDGELYRRQLPDRKVAADRRLHAWGLTSAHKGELGTTIIAVDPLLALLDELDVLRAQQAVDV